MQSFGFTFNKPLRKSVCFERCPRTTAFLSRTPATRAAKIMDVDVKPPEKKVEPLRIMLLGKSGAGKSSSGNTILGRNAFTSDMKLTRVTRHCEKAVGKINDVDVAVIDTPGLFETDRKKDEIMREILKSQKLSEPGPHIFVFVVPLGRMTQEDKDTNALIEQNFGPRVWHYTIVLFTHGDRLEGKTINDVITESDENLRAFIRQCSGGFLVFNNKEPEDQKQVTKFLEKTQTLVALNGGGHYHNGFYPPKERKIRERQECIMVERNVALTEGKLAEQFEGQELEHKKMVLWRREEERARSDAENENKVGIKHLASLLLLLLLLILGLLLSPVIDRPFLPALVLLIFAVSFSVVKH